MQAERGNGQHESGCMQTDEWRDKSGASGAHARHSSYRRGAESRGSRFSAIMLLTLSAMLALALAGCSSGSSKDASGEISAVGMANQAAPAAAEHAAPPMDGALRADAVAYETSTESRDEKGDDAVAGASGAGQGSAGIGALADPGAGLNRKVIYKANVTMKVDSFAAAEEKLKNLIHLSGAYILQFSNSVSANEKGAAYVIKVPADGFSSFLDQLRQIQPELQMQMEGSDVTEEYVDLEARLKAKQAAEARLLAFMDKATKSDDLVRFQSELAGVQEQIEQLKGRMRYLEQNVAFSTIHIRMYEGKAIRLEAAKQGLGDRLEDALTGSAKALGQFGQSLLVFLAALLPVLAVAAFVGIPLYYVIRRQSRARREAAATMRREWNNAVAPSLPVAHDPAEEATEKGDAGDGAAAAPGRTGDPNRQD